MNYLALFCSDTEKYQLYVGKRKLQSLIFIKLHPDFYKKRKALEKDWRPYRINHLSWCEQEMPMEEEMEEGRKNLEVHGNVVDFIVTHCCASSLQASIGEGMYRPDILTKYFQEVARKVEYKKWFFGHYHDNRNLAGNGILIYEQIIRIE